MNGKDTLLSQVFVGMEPAAARKYWALKDMLHTFQEGSGIFLQLQLLDLDNRILSENFYWLPVDSDAYTGLNNAKAASIQAEARWFDGRIELKLSNFSPGIVAFFSRITMMNPHARKRLVAGFYSDSYLSIEPGIQRTIYLEYNPEEDAGTPLVSISGWNVTEQLSPV
jgi:mannosylglycoprotein endo-beta-mannosidase